MDEQEKSLAPQQTDGAGQDWAIEPTGAPEEFGFPEKPTVAQLRCWRNQERFLEEFAKCGIISHAAKAAGVTVATVESWDFKDMHGFKRRKAWAAQVALGHAEREVYRRAIEGIDHPVIYKGEITGSYKQYSDNLLMFLVKKLDPSYRDNHQVNVDNSQHIAITQTVYEVRDYRRNQGAVIEGQSREIPAEGPSQQAGEGGQSA
jgi:hypothetical protein